MAHPFFFAVPSYPATTVRGLRKLSLAPSASLAPASQRMRMCCCCQG
ncbi:MAG: hypothetical protein ACRYF0_21540 [Janthinobacterium lividum]